MSENQDAPEDVASSPDPHYEPVVKLSPIQLKNLEQDEEELIKLRAKSYRYVVNDEDGPQWKERGVGEIKLLKHKAKGTVRVLMRRDKTLKICINHHLLPSMEIKPHCSSNKAFVWNSPADFADEEPSPETLAVKFGSPENAKKFKDAFEKSLKELETILGKKDNEENESKGLADELAKLEVIEKQTLEEAGNNKTQQLNDKEDDKQKEPVEILEKKESED